MNDNTQANTDAHRDIFFFGVVMDHSGGLTTVLLFIQGKEWPVGRIRFEKHERSFFKEDDVLIKRAFQRWLERTARRRQ